MLTQVRLVYSSLSKTMSSGKRAKYLLGKQKYKICSYVVGIYFDDIVLSKGRLMQSCATGYIDP
jgi:hypothetical protein